MLKDSVLGKLKPKHILFSTLTFKATNYFGVSLLDIHADYWLGIEVCHFLSKHF